MKTRLAESIGDDAALEAYETMNREMGPKLIWRVARMLARGQRRLTWRPGARIEPRTYELRLLVDGVLSVLTAVLAAAAWQERIGDALWGGSFAIGPWQLHPLSLLYVLSGSLMISKTLRIPKF